MDTLQQNINNLTALWMVPGKAFQSYHQKENIHYCFISGSEWPNRMWCYDPIVDTDLSIIKEISKGNRGLTLSYFDTGGAPPLNPEHFGLQLRSEQMGMSLLLKNSFDMSHSLQFHNVTDEKGAQLWGKAFKESFGYTISTQTILNTHRSIPWSLVYDNGRLVGTVVLFQTGKFAGIHCLGVIPEMRRKGYARGIMTNVLNQAIENGAELAVLQASKMAEDIYLKAGFSKDFILKNYRFKVY